MTTNPPLSNLQRDVHTALQGWYEADTGSSPLGYLQLFQQALVQSGHNARQATNALLLEALEALAVEHKAGADLLRRRFLDGVMVQTVANQLNVSESTAYRKQQAAVKQLALILQEREAQLREDYQATLEKRLNLPPETPLFGVAEALETLNSALLSPQPVWLVSIEGLGGIGKTALANAFIRRPELSGQFREAAWVSAKQHEFLPNFERDQMTTPALSREVLIDMLLEQVGGTAALTQPPEQKQIALTQALKSGPHLVVIDNLETVADYQALLPLLRELANPTKFILTSRRSLKAYPDIFCYALDELNSVETLRLIRHEATLRGLSLLANAAEADLMKIYEVVGGNPLALKLVVGQLAVLPLSRVLTSLRQAQGQKIEALYSYIYWQAWDMLEANSRQLLLVMPLAQDGTLEQLSALSQLEPDALSQALEQLAALSLVQISGGLEERRYAIHRLTETFLLREAIKWQASM